MGLNFFDSNCRVPEAQVIGARTISRQGTNGRIHVITLPQATLSVLLLSDLNICSTLTEKKKGIKGKREKKRDVQRYTHTEMEREIEREERSK